VDHLPLQIKEPRPQRGSSLQLSTVRDHEGTGQLDPRTVNKSIQYVGVPIQEQALRHYLPFSGATVVFEEPSGAGCIPGGV
jgi:hypothetical protein